MSAGYLDALARDGAAAALVGALEAVEPRDAPGALALLSRLVLTSHGGAAFLNQFVAAGGVRAELMRRLLRDDAPVPVLVDALVIASHLARVAKEGECARGLVCVCGLAAVMLHALATTRRPQPQYGISYLI